MFPPSANPSLRVAAGQRVDKGDNWVFSRQGDGEPHSSGLWIGRIAICRIPNAYRDGRKRGRIGEPNLDSRI